MADENQGSIVEKFTSTINDMQTMLRELVTKINTQTTDASGIVQEINDMKNQVSSIADKISQLDSTGISKSIQDKMEEINSGEYLRQITTALAARTPLHLDNAKVAIDAFIVHLTDDWSNTHLHKQEDLDVKRKINADYHSRVIDQRTVSLIAGLQAVTGSKFNPDQLKVLADCGVIGRPVQPSTGPPPVKSATG